MLTDTKIRNLKPKEKSYKVFDGGGLYLEVTPSGSKLWRYKYRYQGKSKTLALGKYPIVSLAEERRKHLEAKKMLSQGLDPSVVKRQQKIKATKTFEVVAKEWWEAKKDKWSKGHASVVWRRLEANVLPWLKDKPVMDITSRELLDTLKRVEARGAVETARRINQILNQIYVFAIASGYCENNPASNLHHALKEVNHRHLPAITEPKKIAELLHAIDAFEGSFVVKQALRFAPLVFVRPGELRKAEWQEIDLDQALWTISAEKMKKKRVHLVPLSRQAIKILEELRPLTGNGKYVFPSIRSSDRPMSENTLNAALRRLGYTKDEMVVHGFRTMASTRLHEMGWPSHVIEAQLAHVDHNSVRAVYNRAEYLQERRKMMQAWADYLDALKKGAEVIAFKAKV
ncbi:MAG: tyrosine-type recombinase/integrase [Candidatus Desulfofervidus auxilii]|nr:tyrosine-type recombinase/integrase [Candidatus Desulfofervidus auxilii]